MKGFEALLERERIAIDRFVRYRISSKADADDILQEVYLTAYEKFSQLREGNSFKAWILGIARNKCYDYYRKKGAALEIPIDELSERIISYDKHGFGVKTVVGDTIEKLGDKDKQMLYLYYWRELPQAEIAKRLGIPLGTVKSRLHTAKENFRKKYPHTKNTYSPKPKGDNIMKKLPAIMPEYIIIKSEQEPFSVKWDELMGWFLIPRLGESLTWGMYYMPSRKCSHIYDMKVVGKAKVHGIEGVELTAREASYSNKDEVINRTFVAQLTDTHCRYLATVRNDGETRNYITFLDGDEFMPSWGFGEDNCGNETNLSSKGDIKRCGDVISSVNRDFLLDIVGRYTVELSGKRYDTVCVMDIETYNAGVVCEQYLDRNGRTILWRRFNRDDWAYDRYGAKWSEKLPENERITVNGATFVHWYDCITDYIL